jgi:hypothetical protein
MHFITSLLHLWSFSHAQCDAILQSRGITVTNAYYPDKAGSARDSVYAGLLFAIGWLTLVGVMLLFAWRRDDDRSRTKRIILPFFALFGLGALALQLLAMARYVDTCRHFLGLESGAPTPLGESPWVTVFAIAAFAAFWFAILTMMLKKATSPTHRLVVVGMMVIGGLGMLGMEVDALARLVR